ncbi:hypothetical protein QBC39DRAFT_288531 [Podospora conica]|nr:hypothetical protein QBC39DRAFT_288531 [Schizothecium conicum]
MTESASNDWFHFDNQQPKRKRADLVCSACHSKKVKCDLQAKSSEGLAPRCSNCEAAGTECLVRPSKRKKGSQQSVSTTSHQHSNHRALDQERRRQQQSPCPSTPEEHQPPPPPSPPPRRASTATSTQHHHQLHSSPSRSHPHQSQHPTQQHPSQLLQPPQLLEPPPQGPLHDTPQSQLDATADLLVGAATGRSNPSDVDTGFLHVFGPETNAEAEQKELEATLEFGYSPADARQQELQQIYADTYIEFCYTWAPVLNVDTIHQDTLRSPLLANALAVAGSHIRPPLLPHDGPAAYYKRATSIFYHDEDSGGLATLQAVALFYWWAPRSIAVAHRHSSWWWTSVLIRHAQQENLHREPGPGHPLRDVLDLSLRRRIWWTAFARERLTALCQSKPCIIDPTDCTIAPPTLADFPSDPHLQRKGEIFIQWVSLCAIIGRVAKALARPGAAFPAPLRQELADWVHALPPYLQLPISSARTTGAFDRDVHQLHLPYLTTIIVLHLRRSAHDLPQALPPAILAASCIARIMRDILSRGDARFLMAITCWYTSTAFTALLQAARIPALAKDANDGLDVLTTAVEQLEHMWGSARVIRQGFERLRPAAGGGDDGRLGLGPSGMGSGGASLGSLGGGNGAGFGGSHIDSVHESREAGDFDWTVLFPFVTTATSGIAKALLQGAEPGMATRFPSPEGLLFQDAFLVDYLGLLEPFSQADSFGFGDTRFGL